jgi:hypothetical protein
MPLSIHASELKEHFTTQEDLRIFLNGKTVKATMNVKQKQRAVIEFLLLEGREGDDIVLRLQNAYGRNAYCQVSVFRWMNEIRRGSEELRNEGYPGTSHCYKTDAAFGSILRDDPNVSLRTIAGTLSISPEAVRTRMSRIDDTLKSLWRIPHALTSELK